MPPPAMPPPPIGPDSTIVFGPDCPGTPTACVAALSPVGDFGKPGSGTYPGGGGPATVARLPGVIMVSRSLSGTAPGAPGPRSPPPGGVPGGPPTGGPPTGGPPTGGPPTPG